MARDFNGSSDYALYSGLVTDTPLTMACWFNVDNVTASHSLMSFGTNGASNRIVMFANGAVGGDPIVCSVVLAGNSTTDASTTAGFSANTWHHAAISYAADGSTKALLDGANKGTGTNTVTSIATLNRTLLGARINAGTVGAFANGRIAEAGIWGAVLDDAEIASLARGVSPLLVRPDALLAYWPVIGNASPEIDIVGRNELTLTGTTKADHPRMVRPSAQIIQFPSAAGGSVESGAGTAAGTATASAVGDVAGGVQSGAGSSAGTSTASGVGASTAASVGTAAGTSTAAAVGSSSGGVQEGVGTAAGQATAAGVGASTAEAVGTAAGSSTASAVGTDAASQIEAASLAGLRVHAAREAQFFFSKRRPVRRISRASWPLSRAA